MCHRTIKVITAARARRATTLAMTNMTWWRATIWMHWDVKLNNEDRTRLHNKYWFCMMLAFTSEESIHFFSYLCFHINNLQTSVHWRFAQDRFQSNLMYTVLIICKLFSLFFLWYWSDEKALFWNSHSSDDDCTAHILLWKKPKSYLKKTSMQ